jgi:AcrR family transcriptional regulator
MNEPKKRLRRQPQQKRSRDRVERILDAAAEVFDEVGFEAATTQAIAVRADTAIGSLYQFFPDKLAIFHALELRHIERVYAMWERMNGPGIVQLPFSTFIRTLGTELRQLFEQPTSRIVFVQFFTSPTPFKNIDESFTQEAINVMAKLLRQRNPALALERSHLLSEVCVHAINTVLLLALRSSERHSQELFAEIEAFAGAYLRPYIGDEVLLDTARSRVEKGAGKDKEGLSSRQRLAWNYAIARGGLTIQNYEALCPDVSRRTLQRDLQKMVQQGRLAIEGKTNQLYYRLAHDKL